ncbi:bifunctional diaminohydroxyphosphoribosylaminopyrimidine deaminase/5-amino-6-(5-phosphoribosylamino)uracil reductase RibD [Candidatus Peregrinibacteria bacterium]|nr:bifunctional diaminohydroxyphosphoribosylaminopyrimidine deaminase/5-amino-6-(5-phosphoribosylamino)uracil reductase RibD [Candidatus Peregrinibacteria bacterium]
MTTDVKFMSQALKLARLGGRAVAPNPMVGAVVVKDGKVIGTGYHQIFGGPHAEVNAIQSVKRKADLEGATMYVTLEPCRHFGKTPPCFDFIKVMGIGRVVCGSEDPFQSKLRKTKDELQIEFLNGPIATQCQELNKFYFTRITKKRPYITVKIAMSADGFAAGPDGRPVHFTTAKQDREVHKLRAEHQAIMVGSNTVLNDNPHLGVRLVKGEDPLRIILDSKNRIPKKAKVFRNNNVLHITQKMTLKQLMTYLAFIGIGSVLVEPGPTLYHSLKKAGLIDELVVYRSKKKIKQGLKLVL